MEAWKKPGINFFWMLVSNIKPLGKHSVQAKIESKSFLILIQTTENSWKYIQ